MKNWLKVGDKVTWRGGFGAEPPLPATVESIEVCRNGEKYGDHVEKVLWDTVKGHKKTVIVTFSDNDHWARGSQIEPRNK